MTKVETGQWAPNVPADGAVVFLIGMRINQWWRVWRWLPVFLAMPRMLKELMKDPDLGLRGRPRTFVSGRTILVWQQWSSFEHLQAYAKSTDLLHLPAWRRFNRLVRQTPSVGIYHETYIISPGTTEGVYVNVPLMGLGAAFGTRAAEGDARSAAGRLGREATRRAPE